MSIRIVEAPRETLRDLSEREGLRFAGFVFAFGGALLLAGAIAVRAWAELVFYFGDPL